MKKFIFFALLACSLAFMSSEPAYYYPYTPVFMKRADLEAAVKLEAATDIKNPGKIYLKDQWIFINEKYKGYHIIDNSDPSNPVNKAFLHIDGCLDMAIKGNLMYADNAVDLVSILLDPEMNTISVTGRVKNSLPEPSSPEGFWMTRAFENFRPKDGIIVRWEYNENYWRQ